MRLERRERAGDGAAVHERDAAGVGEAPNLDHAETKRQKTAPRRAAARRPTA